MLWREGRGWAAEVRIRAPDGCADASAVVEQVDGLLGRPLRSVDGVDFDVEIVEGTRQRWRLRVDTIDRSEREKRTRELSGRGCAELADAAAVAIAMSIKSGFAGEGGSEQGPAASARQPSRPQPPLAGGNRVQEPHLSRTPSVAPAAPRMRPFIAVVMVVDAGALPRAGLGVAVEGALQWRSLRLVGLASLFPSQETLRSGAAGATGGDFQLALAGLLGCLAQGFNRYTLLVCGGGEGGRLSGQGVGVDSPRSQGALWLAGRADAGVTRLLGSRLALMLRGGVAVPVSRPTFVLEGSTPVHRPDSVTFRATLGVEMGF